MTAEVATFSHGSAEQSARMIKHKFLGSAKITHQLEKGFGKSDFSNINNRSKTIELHSPNRVIHNVRQKLSLYLYLIIVMLSLFLLEFNLMLH